MRARLTGWEGEQWWLELFADGSGDVLGQLGTAFVGVVDVGGSLLAGDRVFAGVVVHGIDRDATDFVDDFAGQLVVEHRIVGDPALGTLRHRRGVTPNQVGAGLFQLADDGPQIGDVVRRADLAGVFRVIGIGQVLAFGRHELQVVKSEVEMDHVPLAVPQPLIDLFDAAGRRPAIGRRPVNVGDAGQLASHRGGVADRDAVADQQDIGQRSVDLVRLCDFLDVRL